MPFSLSFKFIARIGAALLLVFLVGAGWSAVDARQRLQELVRTGTDQVAVGLQTVAAGPAAALRDTGWFTRLPRSEALARITEIQVFDGETQRAVLKPHPEAGSEHDERAPRWFAQLVAGGSPVLAERRLEGARRVVVRFDLEGDTAVAWSHFQQLGAALATAFILLGWIGTAWLSRRIGESEEQGGVVERVIQQAAGPPAQESEGVEADAAPGESSEVCYPSLFASQTSDAILVYDRKGLVTYCNPAAERLFGYEPGDLLGRPVMRLVPPWKRQEVQDDPDAGAKTITELDTQRLTKLGVLIDVSLSSSPLLSHEDGGTVIGWIWSMRDISGRKQEEKIMRLLERSLFMSPDGIIITDASQDNIVIYANPAVETITGYSVADMMGKNPRLLYAQEHNQAGLEQLKKSIRAGASCRVILHNRRKDGRAFWNELSIAPIADAGGRVTHFIGLLRDVTERTHHADQIMRAESRLRTIIDGAPVGICISDENNLLQAVNPFFCSLLGYAPEELSGKPLYQVIPEDVWARIAPARSGSFVGGGEIWLTKKTGERLTLLTNTAFLGGTGAAADVVTFLVDITGRKRAEQALLQEKERAQVTLASIGDGVITTNAKGIVDYLNPVAEKLTGWLNEEAQGMPLAAVLNILDEDTRKPLQDPVERALRLSRMVTVARQALLVREDGKEFAIKVTASPIRDRDKRIIGAVVVFHDITEMRAVARQMSFEARYDALTGLLNRREFEKHLKHALTIAREENKEHVLGYLDLDKFKPVNDTCGHAAGDELLKQVASLIHSRLRESDVLARLGGDEFGVLLHSCSIESAGRIAETIRQDIRDFRFVWGDHTFEIGVSIGLAPITEISGSLNDLINAADSACYAAKNEGRNRVCLYNGEKGESGKTHWMRRIKEALEHDRFCLYHQVAAPLAQGHGLPYCEILLRLQPDEGEFLPPMAFLPAAERYQLMQSIDQWVVSAVLAMLGRGEVSLRSADMVYAINLSAQSLCEEEFADFVVEQLERNGVKPERICFELKETDVMANFSCTVRFIKVLKEKGCRFALDDFGCSRSSFGHLSNLPVDYLKIEGAIIRHLLDSPTDSVLTDTISRIGHLMGAQIIATQVENAGTLEKVKELGLDYAQGFEVARPLPLIPETAQACSEASEGP